MNAGDNAPIRPPASRSRTHGSAAELAATCMPGTPTIAIAGPDGDGNTNSDSVGSHSRPFATSTSSSVKLTLTTLGECRIVAEAATRPPLPLQLAADAEQKRHCQPNPPPTWPRLRESSSELMIDRSLASRRSGHAARRAHTQA